MDALRAVRSLGLESWCLGAGAIRNLVWDALSGHQRPSALSDVDVAFSFRDRTAAKRYAERWPGVTIMPV